MRRPDLVGEQEVAERRAEAAPEPRRGAQRGDGGEPAHERDRAGAERGDEVAGGRPRSLALNAMTDRAAGELGQAEREVRRALHHAERGRAEPEAADVERQHRGDHLVSDVGQ